MVLELLIAAAAAAGSVEPPAGRPDIPRSGRLPHGGRACLIIARCDATPCVLPVQRGRPPLPAQRRCRPAGPRGAAPRVIPATG